MVCITALPRDLVASLLPFLTGFDLIRLSHVSHQFFDGPLAPDGDLWRMCIGSSDAHTLPPTMSWKQFYCMHVSRRFLGASRSRQRDAGVDIFNFDLGRWEDESFSFEMWFALLPAEDDSGTCFGGVLLGAQSEDWQDEWQPETHSLFAYVDPEGGLRCSVGDDMRVLVHDMQPHRWYHLALTFENEGESGVQCVYLDGQLLHADCNATLASKWDELYYMQLATGFTGPFDPMNLRPVFAGWHDLNGVIDSFRIYESCLTPDDVAVLAHCRSPPLEAVWTFSPHDHGMFGTSQQIRCTRPRERVCTDIIAAPTE